MNTVNFYDVFSTIQRCSRVLGLTCFTIKKRGHIFKAIINECDLFLLFLSLWWHFSVFLVIYFKPTSVIEMNVEILTKLYNSSLMKIFLCFSFLVMFLNVWFMIVKEKFVVLLNLMTLIDNQVRSFFVLIKFNNIFNKPISANKTLCFNKSSKTEMFCNLFHYFHDICNFFISSW